MGTCISCCKHGDSSDSTDPYNSQPIDALASSKKELVTCPREPGTLSTIESNNACITNGNSNQGTLSRNSTEKRMFYSRIPLSGGSEGKRASQGKDISESKINSLFEMYKDPNEDAILSEGIEKFCRDLEVKPEEFKVLVLAWRFNAETMCRFTRDEFVTGCKSLRVDSIKAIQNKLPELVKEVDEDPEKFKELYRFTFRFGLDSESGQRILPSEMAIGLWKLVFSRREPSVLNRWVSFLERNQQVRGVPRDTWYMFLNFSEAVGDDLSVYDDTEAWPSLFDDFVEYENDQTNQNVQDKKEESE